jgi:hypothetical protein
MTTLQPYQQRVVDERADLHAKLHALLQFMAAPSFRSVEDGERGRLLRQAGIMHAYIAVLTDRIAAFAPELSALPGSPTEENPALASAPDAIKEAHEERCRASNVCPVCMGSGNSRSSLSGICRRCSGSGRWVKP